MTNVLLSIAPEPAGRALLAVRPAAVAPSAPAAGIGRFGDALPVVDAAFEGAIATVGATSPANVRVATTDEHLDDELVQADVSGNEQSGAQPVALLAVTLPASQPITVQMSAPAELTRSAMPATPDSGVGVSPPAATVDSVSTPGAAALATTVLAPPHIASALRAGPTSESLVLSNEQGALMGAESSSTPGASIPAFTLESTKTMSVVQPAAIAKPAFAALLADRLEFQIQQRSEQAVIRLDPPSMGSIEIIIRQEAGALQVHMRASNSEVARQLHAIGDTLRQDLVQRQHGDVSVQVSEGSREQDGRHRQRAAAAWPQEPGRALQEADEKSAANAFTLNAE